MEHLRSSDYDVRPIVSRTPEWDRAKSFIFEHHYSRGCSHTAVYMHGLYRRASNDLLGVAMWLPPTRVAAESVNKLAWRKVLSLSRLVIHPSVPTNGATFLMARSIRLIRQDGRFVSLVTYADEFMGHTGAIYRGANWTFIGTSPGTPRWEDETGRQVSNRATKSRTAAQMRALGYKLVGSFRKHKFVMHLRVQKKPLRLANDNAILWFAVAV